MRNAPHFPSRFSNPFESSMSLVDIRLRYAHDSLGTCVRRKHRGGGSNRRRDTTIGLLELLCTTLMERQVDHHSAIGSQGWGWRTVDEAVVGFHMMQDRHPSNLTHIQHFVNLGSPLHTRFRRKCRTYRVGRIGGIHCIHCIYIRHPLKASS